MSVLAGLKTKTQDASIKQENDSVGGGFVLDSAIYDMAVKMAYIGKSKGGAMSLNLIMDNGGKEFRSTLWVTSGDAKGNLPYYEKDGEKTFLPGYNQANALCLLTLGKELADLDTDQKVIKLYVHEQKAEVNTPVDAITELEGEKISLGILRQTVDKNTKDASGNYVPSGETRDENEIDKMFRIEDGMTVAEIRAEAEEATFKQTWSDKWTGVTKDRSTKGAAAGGTAGAPAGGAAPGKSLFGKK